MSVPPPPIEQARLEALRRYRILDTDAEESFDDITLLASYICDVPVSFLTFVDADRQWMKSTQGTNIKETPRDVAFCAHTILGSELFIVRDAREDARFADNPLVHQEPRIRFYAGAPLETHDGHRLGSLCVIDRSPRELSLEQKRALRALSRQVVAQLELRRVTDALACTLEEMRTLEGLLPICSYCKKVRDDQGYWQAVESYISRHSAATFTHGICPTCMEERFPGV